MGRNTSGVKGIRLRKSDSVVGMVVADPAATLLTVCQNGYGKPGSERVRNCLASPTWKQPMATLRQAKRKP